MIFSKTVSTKFLAIVRSWYKNSKKNITYEILACFSFEDIEIPKFEILAVTH